MAKALYLHVPFCEHICAYCDFFRFGYHKQLADRWLDAIALDIKEQLTETEMKTIYIGGGTPSALSLSQLDYLLTLLDPYAKQVEEYTMEANGESLTLDKIECMKSHGINRISLGVQTFQKPLIQIIERNHDVTMIHEVIDQLHHAGIHNISIDLMYGLPSQTLAMWKQDLHYAIKHLDITHISLYALTIEEHSTFGRNKVKNIDPGLEADMYEMAMKILKEAGFEHYEISSFAKPGFQSRHNSAYWHYDDFYGIGCGASGKLCHVRYEMVHNIQSYVSGKRFDEQIFLSKEDEMFETVMMGLRMKEGISLERFHKCFGISFDEVYKDTKNKLIQDGYLIEREGRLQTTYQGMMFLNDVLEAFL